MQEVDSQALQLVSRALRLSTPGAQRTDFTDEQLIQVLDVSALVRRGLALAETAGVFDAVLSNVHAAAGTLTSTVNPYQAGAAAIAPFPAAVPDDMEAWLLGASCEQIGGSGTFKGALYLNPDDSSQGFGINDSGVPVVRSNAKPLAFWDSMVTASQTIGLEGGQRAFQKIGLRLPRMRQAGSGLIWASVASAATTFDCQLWIGLFPIGMGQDIAV